MTTTYKRQILMKLLEELHPGVPIWCDTTYASIQMHDIGEPIPLILNAAFTEKIRIHTQARLKPESAIQEKYLQHLLNYNLMLLRRERNQRLFLSDVYTLSDFPHASTELKAAWLTYRQALRDITKTNPTPMVDDKDNLIGIEWPTKPT